MVKPKKAEDRDSSTVRDPRERFISLANKRVESAIQQLRLVGNLANRKNYEFTDAEGKKIVRALQAALDDVKERFKGDEQRSSGTFRL